MKWCFLLESKPMQRKKSLSKIISLQRDPFPQCHSTALDLLPPWCPTSSHFWLQNSPKVTDLPSPH